MPLHLIPRNRQPQQPTSLSSFGRSLGFTFALHGDHEAVSGQAPLSVSATAANAVGRYGSGWAPGTTGGAGRLFPYSAPAIGTGAFTLLVITDNASGVGSYSHLTDVGGVGLAFGSLGWAVGVPGTRVVTDTTTAGNVSAVRAVVRADTSATGTRLYVNGARVTSGQMTNSLGVKTSAGLLYTATNPATLHFPLLALAPAALPDDLIARLAANPWQLFEPRRIWVSVSAGGVSGTSATTNANDTSSASGTTTVTGTLSRTNANDTSSASGTTTVVGTSATTNANDTSSASGTVGSGSVTGTSATTNANDTSSASGTTTVVGTSATTNANDSVSAAGWAGVVSGTSATTNANDTASASGSGGAVAPSTAPTPAGRPRRRMVYVEIDGKPVVVGSEEEAAQLLEKLEEKAQEVARVAVERASKANKRPTRKVLADARKTLEVPRISTPGRQDLGARYRERIREIYEQAAQAIEIAARMRDLEMAIEADDEEVLLLL